MGWRDQPACSTKASWGPTCIVIYQGKALLGLHHLPSEITLVPYHVLRIWVVQAVLLDAAVLLCAIRLRVPMGRDALPVLGFSSASPLFRQVIVFFLLGPAKYVPTGGPSDSAD